MKVVGIYKITNPKGKVYIGQSHNIEERFKAYRRLACKKQVKLYNSLSKYRPKDHKYEIIEECVSMKLDDREIYWIGFYNCIKLGLNIREGGSGGKHSQETKRKISIGNRGKKLSKETRNKIKNSPNRKKNISKAKRGIPNPTASRVNKGNKYREGKKMTQSSKSKISKANIGRKQTKEEIDKRSKSLKGTKHSHQTIERRRISLGKPIIQYDLKNIKIKEWDSLKEASSFLSIDPTGISKVLKGKYKTSGNYIWKYKK